MSIERTKEMIKVMQAYCEGKPIEVTNAGWSDWEIMDKDPPSWSWHHLDYRIAVTKPVVPWDALADWVNFVARDEDGDFYGFETRPKLETISWSTRTLDHNIYDLDAVKIDPGTCDWRESLVERPKGDK